jgi:alpha-1,2-mannosyltransferase
MTRTGEAARRIITDERVKICALSFLSLSVLSYVVRVLERGEEVGGLSRDFLCFWAVSRLSLDGDPGKAFDLEALFAVQRSIGAGESVYTWSYPPAFQLFTLPLALVPPLASQVFWCAISIGLFAVGLRRLLPAPYVVLTFCSTSLFVTNVFIGQADILVAAFYLFGLASLSDERTGPPIGAAAFGLAAVKPQIGLFIPIALLARREWSAFWIATLTLAAMCASSLVVFGPELWLAFFEMSGQTIAFLVDGHYPAPLLASFYSLLRSLDIGENVALGIHAALAVVVAAVTIHAIRISRSSQLAGAAAIAGGLLIFPYAYYYDLLLLSGPMAIVAKRAFASTWLPGEKGLLVVLWVGPLCLVGPMNHFDVSLSVLVTVLAYGLIVRRIFAEAPDAKGTPWEPALASRNPGR